MQLGAGLVLRGELHRGHNGAAGELDYALGSLGAELDPCAGAVVTLAEELAVWPEGQAVGVEPGNLVELITQCVAGGRPKVLAERMPITRAGLEAANWWLAVPLRVDGRSFGALPPTTLPRRRIRLDR